LTAQKRGYSGSEQERMARTKFVTVSPLGGWAASPHGSDFYWWRKAEPLLSDFIISTYKLRNVVAGVLVNFCATYLINSVLSSTKKGTY